MIRRLFWIGVGVAGTVWVQRRSAALRAETRERGAVGTAVAAATALARRDVRGGTT